MIHSFSNFSTVVLCLSNASCSFWLVVAVVLLRVNLFFHCNSSEDFIAFIYSIYDLTSVYCLLQKIFQQDIVIMGKDREERRGRAWCLELVPFQLKVQVKTSVYVEMMGSSAQSLHCGAKLKAHSQLKSNRINMSFEIQGCFSTFVCIACYNIQTVQREDSLLRKGGRWRFSNVSDVKILLVFYMHYSK